MGQQGGAGGGGGGRGLQPPTGASGVVQLLVWPHFVFSDTGALTNNELLSSLGTVQATCRTVLFVWRPLLFAQ